MVIRHQLGRLQEADMVIHLVLPLEIQHQLGHQVDIIHRHVLLHLIIVTIVHLVEVAIVVEVVQVVIAVVEDIVAAAVEVAAVAVEVAAEEDNFRNFNLNKKADYILICFFVLIRF
jgi:hypothetical protein